MNELGSNFKKIYIFLGSWKLQEIRKFENSGIRNLK